MANVLLRFVYFLFHKISVCLIFFDSCDSCVEAEDDGFYGRVVYYVIVPLAAGFELLNRRLLLDA